MIFCRLKCTKFDFGQSSARHCWSSLQRSPRLPMWI